MQKLIYIILAALGLTIHAYTENQIKIKINQNEKGEMVFNISGHSNPVVLEVNGKSKQIEVNENEVNMEKEFNFSNSNSLNTSSGNEKSNVDIQAPVSPVNMSAYPPAATPI
jgi:hypothetical protein